ncbi:MAG: response regulator transcription factor [bacterium]|nr:response regulator transcription factor [Candidatus Kapabacteria bacterium]
MKLYIAGIGALFLALGLGVGIWLRRRKTDPSVNDHPGISGMPIDSNSAVALGADARDHLSARESEVLLLIAAGHTNRQIAERLFVSENTIKTHVNNIYAKLEVNRRTQAVARAKELGILN